MLHPTAEAYRAARAAGDDVTAARHMIDAHTGTYDSGLIDQMHAVGRMTREQLRAPAVEEPDTGSDELVRVTTRVFRRR